MPAKDIFHDAVKTALIKSEWVVTDDPLSLKVGEKDLFIDLAAEKLIVAEKQNKQIAVEIKSFVGASEIEDLKNALGQYILYEKVLSYQNIKRILYLAIRESTYNNFFEAEIGKILLATSTLKLIVFDAENEVIIKWIE